MEMSESVKKYVDKSQPKDLRLLAASGIIPAPSGELVLILYLLTKDEDAEVAETAVGALNDIPTDVILSVLSDKSAHPEILDYFARNIEGTNILQVIVLNSSTTDSTVAYIAGNTHTQETHDLIANNHERIVRSESIVEALSLNPSVSRSTLDSVIEYIRLCLGDELEANFDIEGDIDREDTDNSENSGEHEETFLDQIEIADELIDDEDDPEEEVVEERRQNIQQMISIMAVGEKIKLSILGNREARTILVRDPNRVVSRAVLKNPRLTEAEIVLISQSKIVNDEILREISDNRRWIRMYKVKLSLVNNPKTPPHISMTLIRRLRDFDIKVMTRNRNLPSALMSAARRVIEERKLNH